MEGLCFDWNCFAYDLLIDISKEYDFKEDDFFNRTFNNLILYLRTSGVPFKARVVELLMRNPGKVYSREQLLDLVWGYDYQGDIRTVDVRIANLRKKLNLSEEIRTISKAGYRLEER